MHRRSLLKSAAASIAGLLSTRGVSGNVVVPRTGTCDCEDFPLPIETSECACCLPDKYVIQIGDGEAHYVYIGAGEYRLSHWFGIDRDIGLPVVVGRTYDQ